MDPEKTLLQISNWKATRQCMVTGGILWLETTPSGQKESTSKTQNAPFKYLLRIRGREVETETREGITWFKIVLNKEELGLEPETILGRVLKWQVDVVPQDQK